MPSLEECNNQIALLRNSPIEQDPHRLHNLASAYYNRATLASRTPAERWDDLTQAIQLAETSKKSMHATPEQRGNALYLRCAAYIERGKFPGRDPNDCAEDFIAAIVEGRASLLTPATTQQHVTKLLALSDAYCRLGRFSQRENDFLEAIKAADRVSLKYDTSQQEKCDGQRQLYIANFMLGTLPGRDPRVCKQDFTNAIQAANNNLRLTHPEQSDQQLIDLYSAYRKRGQNCSSPAEHWNDLLEATKVAEGGLSLATAPGKRGFWHESLCSTYLERARLPERSPAHYQADLNSAITAGEASMRCYPTPEQQNDRPLLDLCEARIKRGRLTTRSNDDSYNDFTKAINAAEKRLRFCPRQQKSAWYASLSAACLERSKFRTPHDSWRDLVRAREAGHKSVEFASLDELPTRQNDSNYVDSVVQQQEQSQSRSPSPQYFGRG